MANPNYTVRTYGADASMLYIGTTPWGPSLGGYEFQPGPQYRTLEGDGLTTEKEGMTRIAGWDSHIRGRLKDLSPEVLLAMSPGSASDGSSPNNAISNTTARVPLTADEMLTDVRLIYRTIDPVTGNAQYNAIVYGLARVEPWSQTGEDVNEQARSLDIKGILPAAHSADECPYVEIEDYDHDSFDIDDYFTLS